MFDSVALRQKYLRFFVLQQHTVIASASVIPENDPTVLFTTAGMHPLVPYLLGERHPLGRRLTNIQKCIRTQDIDEVGDNRHITFFEMMGNWSLGDYFKKEAIEWSFAFLTDVENGLGLDVRKLAVSVFAGDTDAPRDVESAAIWHALGIPEERIVYLPKSNNWWGPAGQSGPCGPDTEMFFWRGDSEFPPPQSNPGNDESNWLEIWNDVFMEYEKTKDGVFMPLQQKNVDTGMGLERTLMILNGWADVFQIDTFWPLIQKIQELSGREYVENSATTKSIRVIADHIRTATMIMGDDRGIAPSNVDQGYIVRRLIRRAVRHGRLLGIKENFCSRIAREVIAIFAPVYPEVARNQIFVLEEIAKEESKFRNTIEQGLKEFAKLIDGFRIAFEKTGRRVETIAGKQAFKLYDTYGFPLEMTQELAWENGLKVNVAEFESAFHAHQELSRAGAEQKFKGGLADTSEMSTKYHTATHLLLAGLRNILSSNITQKGSNITAERLRFDFNWPEKLTSIQLTQVEEWVNDKIQADMPVEMLELNKDEAKKLVTVLSFDLEKYGERVKVYKIGDVSAEFCGGPHVERTGLLGKFQIMKEEAVSAGTRRIKAILL